MRLLVTAGPTREPVDPVRFLSNRSTGAMGLAIARAALRRGHEVVLVLGPVALRPPRGARVIAVETAREMRAAVMRELAGCDLLVFAAAVADFRPAKPSRRKIKRGEMRPIRLVENPDIAAEAGRRRGRRPMVIFALETGAGVRNALDKVRRKNADLCVLNAPEAIGARTARFRLVHRNGTIRDLGRTTKESVAAEVLRSARPGGG